MTDPNSQESADDKTPKNQLQTLDYIALRLDENQNLQTADEFVLRLENEEMALLCACHLLRKEKLQEAEQHIPNYKHIEPFKIEGKTRSVEITSPLQILSYPLFKGSTKKFDQSEDSIEECAKIIAYEPEYRFEKECGLQILTSLAWVAETTKARPPNISPSSLDLDLKSNLLPSNLKVLEEQAPLGYNKIQSKLLSETQSLTLKYLSHSNDETKNRIKSLSITTFAEFLFQTFSQIYNQLPDPEEEERNRFETMKKSIEEKKKAEEENDE